LIGGAPHRDVSRKKSSGNLGAGARVEFLKDVAHMNFDRCFADDERTRYLTIREPNADECGDFTLAWG
jgi:hypothetical protein